MKLEPIRVLAAHLNSPFRKWVVAAAAAVVVSALLFTISASFNVIQALLFLGFVISSVGFMLLLFVQNARNHLELKAFNEQMYQRQQHDLNLFYSDLTNLQHNTKATIDWVVSSQKKN